MKHKRLYILLAAETAVLTVLLVLTGSFPALFSSLFAFPFEQIGAVLRALSLSGRLGNGLALMLWGALSLSPLLAVLRHMGEPGRRFENMARGFLSASLLFALWGMADPSLLLRLMPSLAKLGLGIGKALMGGLVWSVFVFWLILCLLRLFKAGDMPRLLTYSERMLYVLCALYIAEIVLSCGGALSAALKNAGGAWDRFFQILGFVVSALPYGMDLAVTVRGIDLLQALGGGDRAMAETAAGKLSRLCCLSLAVSAGSVALFNMLQLLFASRCTSVSVNVAIPVMSMAFVLAVLLVSRLIAENRRLQDDNDLFI